MGNRLGRRRRRQKSEDSEDDGGCKTKQHNGDIIKLQSSEVEDVDEGGPNCWNIPVAATIVLKDDSEVGRGLSNKLH